MGRKARRQDCWKEGWKDRKKESSKAGRTAKRQDVWKASKKLTRWMEGRQEGRMNRSTAKMQDGRKER